MKSHAQIMFEKLFVSKRFADVICEVEDEEIHAHKVVLAERSQYFSDLLSSSISFPLIKKNNDFC